MLQKHSLMFFTPKSYYYCICVKQMLYAYLTHLLHKCSICVCQVSECPSVWYVSIHVGHNTVARLKCLCFLGGCHMGWNSWCFPFYWSWTKLLLMEHPSKAFKELVWANIIVALLLKIWDIRNGNLPRQPNLPKKT